MTKVAHWGIIALSLMLQACSGWFGASHDARQPDYYSMSPFENDTLRAVIEIPAGTNNKIEWDQSRQQFLVNQVDGRDRVVDFLPYPGNYGFIPGTLMDEARGGDGDPLDVLVLCPSFPTASIVKIKPIAALLLEDNGEIDTKIIAIPTDPETRSLRAENFLDFILTYDAARLIVEEWFLSYKGDEQTRLLRWEDEAYALREINKWRMR
jgi:inorganic pyrophosphatase